MRDETALQSGEYQAEYVIYAGGVGKIAGNYFTSEITDSIEKNSKLRPYFRDEKDVEFKLFYACSNVGNKDFYINRVRENFIMFLKNTGDGLGSMVVGIYFDASTSNWR